MTRTYSKPETLDPDKIWRVEFCNGYARVDRFNISNGLPSSDSYYERDELPEWLSRRVAVLSCMPCDIPTDIIPGVGRRISENVYWVVEDEQS